MTTSKKSRQKVKPEKEDFFELIVSNPNHASPFLQFSWCVNKKGIECLRKEQVLHPFLLVVILNKKAYGEEWEDYIRQLYPLDRGLGHIEFNRPGEYKIHASVIWTFNSSKGRQQKVEDARKELYNKYKDIKRGKYSYNLHDEETYRPDYLEHNTLSYHDKISVIVDKNLFAPEPSNRMKWWVNMLWDYKKPKNQCDWRRRKIIAFSIQPLLVLIFLIIRSIIAVAWVIFLLFIGYYPNKIGWKAVIHPFDMNICDIVDTTYDIKNVDNYWWITNPDRIERSKVEKILMSPITGYGLVIVFLIFVESNIFRMATLIGFLDWNILLACFIFVIVVMATSLLLYKICILIINRFFSKKLKLHAEERLRRKQEEETKRKRNEQMAFQSSLSFFYDQRLKPLACTERTREATLTSLPETHRTLQLRFMDLKVKVCKPFRG
ncbi:MAG: hypothetical protein V1851_02460 [Patescibacteria group bacterium]